MTLVIEDTDDPNDPVDSDGSNDHEVGWCKLVLCPLRRCYRVFWCTSIHPAVVGGDCLLNLPLRHYCMILA